MIKHVWFDVAGVLYRLTPEIVGVRDKVLYKAYAEVVGQPDISKAKSEYDSLYKRYGSNSAVFHSLGRPSNFWQKVWEQNDHLSPLLEPDNEVTKTLAAIKEKVPISIFSNFRIGRIRKILAKLEIPENFFTYILDGDDVPERKPNRAGFYKMVELSKLSPDQVLYVGDRVETDIIPAKEVGMTACLIYSNSPLADFSVRQFPELLQFL